ncbi:hypothetical protein [Mucisphaera sp.]|uniref:hypothetical protein n=1 Tax=Mucisphaera sp. TaxID=2913024 RepID=UPI003D0B1D3A
MQLTSPPAVLGSIEFPKGSSRLAAHLDEDRHWHCDDPEIEILLTELCPLEAESPDEPENWSIRYCLYTAAQRLGGQVRFGR